MKRRLSCDVILVLLLAMDRAGHCSGNALYVCTGGALFASRPWQRFFWGVSWPSSVPPGES